MKTLVDIIMLTYNQEKYIGLAIESVLMQKTNFQFKLIIGEDCSTDNTYEICKRYALEYPDRINLLENSSNLGLLKNYLRCFQQCAGKYIAILEGDDYWVDPLKIQKQVELMESDENIGLVHTNYKTLNENTNEISSLSEKVLKKASQFQGYIYSEIMKQNFICSITAMFRRNILVQIDFNPFIKNNCNTVDIIIWFQIAINYKVAMLPDEMAIYRICQNSISNNIELDKIEKFTETKYYIKKYYLSKHKVKGYSIKDLKRSKDVFLLFKAIKAKDYGKIIKYFKRFSLTGLVLCIKEWKVYNY